MVNQTGGAICQVYYLDKAREIALNNAHDYHLVAWAKRGSSIVYGTNSSRCSTRFRRVHPDGTEGFHLHAEMDLIRRFKPGEISEVTVTRFSKRGNLTMSKPCLYCQKFLREHGVRKVYYTDWNGKWNTMKL
jgi:hypothetical protein